MREQIKIDFQNRIEKQYSAYVDRTVNQLQGYTLTTKAEWFWRFRTTSSDWYLKDQLYNWLRDQKIQWKLSNEAVKYYNGWGSDIYLDQHGNLFTQP